jgi:uncharacterized RDD family membrane protein YckC
MTTVQWHYDNENRPRGPFTEDELVARINRGEIHRDTLVWAEHMDDWAPAGSVGELSRHFPHPGEEVEVTLAPHEVLVSQVQPWARFFARCLDYLTFNFVIIVIAIFTVINLAEFPGTTPVELYVFAMVMSFLWIFIEAILLSVYGTTPGKYIFGIRVVGKRGKKLSFGAAFKRALLVWVKGVGLALPVVNIITAVLGYRQLERKHVTSWDRDSNAAVEHHHYSILSPIFYFIIILVLVFLLGILALIR